MADERAGVRVTVSGLDGKLGEVALEPLHSVADLSKRVAALLGPEAPFFRLVCNGKVLRDHSLNFRKLVGGGAAAEVTAVKLEGPDLLSLEQLQRFKDIIDQATEPSHYKDGDLGFSLKHLQFLSLVSFPTWLPSIYENEPSRGGCHDGMLAFSCFLEALKTMTGLTELDLRENHVPDEEGFHSLASAFPRSLEVLRLDCPMMYMSALADGMLQGDPMAKLRELHFSPGWGADLGRTFVEGLASCLPSLTGLEVLTLRGCKLLPQDLAKLAPALPKGLKSLDLTGNFSYDNAEDGVLPELGPFLRELPSLQELHLTFKENSEASQAGLRQSLSAGCKTVFEQQVAVQPVQLAPSFHAEASVPVRGFWASECGEFRIFDDTITGQLSYEEFIGDGSERLHGRLEDMGKDGGGCQQWRASLMILEQGQKPWYGPSSGAKPDVVGEIMVTLRVGEGGSPELETRIKTEDDKDWQKPMVCRQLVD